jgi:hypothetical protein
VLRQNRDRRHQCKRSQDQETKTDSCHLRLYEDKTKTRQKHKNKTRLDKTRKQKTRTRTRKKQEQRQTKTKTRTHTQDTNPPGDAYVSLRMVDINVIHGFCEAASVHVVRFHAFCVQAGKTWLFTHDFPNPKDAASRTGG